MAGMLTWLSVRPGLWTRFDLTQDRRQTLDPTLAALIEKLPRKVTAEVFFRPPDEPLTQVGLEAQQRMRELLFVAVSQLPEKLAHVEHDLSDVTRVSTRMQELGLREPNVIVLREEGGKQVVLRLFRDLARVDPGNPEMRRPPSLDAFLGDQALGRALLELGIDERPRIYFTTGQGERELLGTDVLQLGDLALLLAGDGFETATWSPAVDPNVPADCDVLAVVDPRQPFPAEALESMHDFLARGGRMLVTPSQERAALDGPGSMAVFLRQYGIEVQAGFVGHPVVSSLGQPTYRDPRCGFLYVGAEGMDRRHPVTESLWSVERRVLISTARSFRRGIAPENCVVLDLLRTPRSSWIDVPDAAGRLDWFPDPRLEEKGSFAVAMAAAFEVEPGVGPPVGGERSDELAAVGAEARPQARLLALGSSDALANGDAGQTGPIDVNRDFALNVFNWLTSRDHRLVIRPREYVARVLDLSREGAQRTMNRVTTLLIPGLALLVGVAVWFRRRR